MQIQISPSIISGRLNAQPSKSYMQRTVVAALLTKGITKIYNPCFADDSVNILKIAETLGAKIINKKNEIHIEGGIYDKDSKINVGESGLALRILIPILSTFKSEYIINGTKSLQNRRLGFDTKVLTDMGATIKTQNSSIPVSVKGEIKGGGNKIDASETSQFLSGLLFALPLLKYSSEIIVTNLNSKPYINLSIEILNRFGIIIENKNYKHFYIKASQQYKPQNITIENDWSSASFMLVAGTIAGQVELRGLNTESLQADKQIISVLKKAGANIEINKNIVKVEKSKLKAFDFDATDCPDLFPSLVVLALNCNGKSTIKGVTRLLNKESNRAVTIVNEFAKLGAKIEITDNKMIIHQTKLTGGKVHSNNDHRIAMSLAIAALNANNKVIIDNCECVSKSYPFFFQNLKSLVTPFEA